MCQSGVLEYSHGAPMKQSRPLGADTFLRSRWSMQHGTNALWFHVQLTSQFHGRISQESMFIKATDQFIGKLIQKGLKKTRFGKKLLRSPFARALNTIHTGIRGVTRKLLPVAGKVVGGFFGGPAGAALGGSVGSAASRVFELELEGLGAEDQEFEVARRIVRLGGESVKQAAVLPKRGSPEAKSCCFRSVMVPGTTIMFSGNGRRTGHVSGATL